MAIQIIEEKCKGCGLCVKNCPFDAVELKEKLAVLKENCTSCGVCIEKCPFAAIEQVEEKKAGNDFSSYHGVWVFVEQNQGKILNVSLELLGEGRKLADEIGTELCAIVPGYQIKELAKSLIGYGADKVYVADAKELEQYTTDGYVKVIHEAIVQYKPEIVLYGATHVGRDLAPSLAVKAGTGLTADCTQLDIDPDDKKLKQTRPAFGGNLMATIICPDYRPQMSTVRPGVMEKAVYDASHTGEIIDLPVVFQEGDIRTKILKVVSDAKNMVSLTDAEVIVAGGKGLGSKEGFDLLKKLADKLGGTIAGSRVAIEDGWIDPAYQVGQTGVTVKPKIYIACGISGAIQHITGMKGSDYIVAINTDKRAPIFDIADYGLVGDLYDIVPQMIEVLDQE